MTTSIQATVARRPPLMRRIRGTTMGVLLMAGVPAVFWTGIAHVVADLFGFALSPVLLAAIGLGVFAVLFCACAIVAAAA